MKGGNFYDEFRGSERNSSDPPTGTTTDFSSETWHESCAGKGKTIKLAKFIFDKTISSGAGVVILCAILAHMLVHREK